MLYDALARLRDAVVENLRPIVLAGALGCAAIGGGVVLINTTLAQAEARLDQQTLCPVTHLPATQLTVIFDLSEGARDGARLGVVAAEVSRMIAETTAGTRVQLLRLTADENAPLAPVWSGCRPPVGAGIWIWGNKTNPVDQTDFLRQHTFAQVRQRRLERERPPDPEGVRFSEPIFAAVERRLAAGNDEQNANIALALARIAFGLPNEGRGNLLDRLIASAAASAAKQRLLMQIVLNGATINADHVLQGLRELLVAARAKTWLLDERTDELKDWLALFAFSDQPEAVFDAWDLLPAERRGPHRLDRLVIALGHTPDDRADQVLLRLAREHVDLLTGHDWIAALEARRTISAARIVCDLAIDGTLPASQSGYQSTSQHVLAAAMNADPKFRAELYGTYRSLPPGPAKTLLSHAIAEVPDSEGILELVNSYITDRQPFGGPLQLALHSIAQIEESIGDRSGTYYVFSRPLPELRKKLFALTAGEPFQAELAKQCLEMIDSLRDIYGSVETEPRHPDIDSGRPWPILQA